MRLERSSLVGAGWVMMLLLVSVQLSPSGEHITRLKIFGLVYILTVHTSHELANIPEEILLEDAFASNAELITKCIQARLCGVGLPTTVKDCHGGVINHGDLVTVEIHSRHTVVGNNLGVSRRPVLVCLDSGVHLLFDLTHLVSCLVDFYTIQEMRQGTTDAVPLVSLVSEHAEMGIHHEVDDLISGRHVETVAVPIDCHLSGCHGVKHEVLEVLEGLSHLCFVHLYTIHDLGCCAYFVCHLGN